MKYKIFIKQNDSSSIDKFREFDSFEVAKIYFDKLADLNNANFNIKNNIHYFQTDYSEFFLVKTAQDYISSSLIDSFIDITEKQKDEVIGDLQINLDPLCNKDNYLDLLNEISKFINNEKYKHNKKIEAELRQHTNKFKNN